MTDHITRPNANTGHGHVIPRPDGVRARCGGPGFCRVCQQERAALAAPDHITRLKEALGAYEARAKVGARAVTQHKYATLLAAEFTPIAARELLDRLEAAEKERDELKAEVHNLNWALGTPGHEQMATPEQQAEADAAVARTDEFIARLAEGKAKYEAMKKDARRYRWLRDHECNSLHLSRDGDHAGNYMTASDWIDNNSNWYDEVPEEELQRMRESNTIWALQIYPHTPVSFNWWHGATLDAAIDTAIAAQEEK